jgi:hypothetical protein
MMMTPYFFAFLDELKRHEHDVESWQYISDENCPKLTLAARHPCVGPLVLYDEGNELTLEFGTKYHCHFHGSDAISGEADKMIEASRLAAKFVDRILHERIGVAVYFNDRGCTGASLIYLDELGLTAETLASSDAKIHGGLIRTERFLWTGPVTNPT